MKIKYLLFALVFGAIVACDPQVDDKDLKITSVTKLEIGTLTQYSDAEGTVADPNGKYFYYEFSEVPSVVVYYIDEGVEITLDSGKSGGIFEFRVMTEETELISQTIYFRYVDITGKEVTCSFDVTFNSTELTTEIRYIAGMNGKAWTWDTSAPDGTVWGNMGYRAGTFDDIFENSCGCKWWGVYCTSKDEEGSAYDDDGNPIEGETDGCSFESQLGHMNEDHTFETSGGDLNAYMTIGSSGAISCYGANGDLLRSGVWDISDYDETGESHDYFYQGFLNVTNGAILWPYEINSGGNIISTFELIKLTDTQMMLAYPDGGDMSEAMNWSWAEASFWRFAVADDIEVYIETSEESLQNAKGWTWAYDYNCWGNAGYGAGGADASSVGDGRWWGFGDNVNEDEGFTIEDVFYQQFIDNNHCGGDEQALENEGWGSYMTFDKSGNLLKFNPDGEKVGTGTYDVDWDNNLTKDGNMSTYGYMTTGGDGILMPYQINTDGNKTDWFDIAYIDSDVLILLNSVTAVNWAEGTWWRFNKRK